MFIGPCIILIVEYLFQQLLLRARYTLCAGHFTFILKTHLENSLVNFNYQLLQFILESRVLSLNI